MYEVTERRRKLEDGTEITTYTREVISCNILQVEAGTNGFQGGDSGHGSRTYFRIKDLAIEGAHAQMLQGDRMLVAHGLQMPCHHT